MPQTGPSIKITGIAGGTLTDKQYYGVTLETDEKYDLADSAGEYISGILASPNKADDTIVVNDAISIVKSGRTSVVAGASFDCGVFLQIDASGMAILAATDDIAFGESLRASTASGDIVPVWLFGSPTITT